MKNALQLLVTLLALTSVLNARHTHNTLKSEYDVSKAVVNAHGAVYSCVLFQSSAIFGTRGDEWVIGFNTSETNENLRHHLLGFELAFTSSLFKEGGLLENVQNGDVIYDCSGIIASTNPSPKTIFAEQAGNDALDLLSMFGDDGSTANGYPYGIPVGARTGSSWWCFEMHVHADMFNAFDKVPIIFQVTGTTDAPKNELVGMAVFGTITPNPFLHPLALMNIPINSDGQYTITSEGLPAARSCDPSIFPDATKCESCCPSSPQVYYDNPLELAMDFSGYDEVYITTALHHYHHLGVKAESWITHLDGTETPIGTQIGHGNALHALNTPLRFTPTDGLKVKCTYERHDGNTANIVGGYKTSEEMCLVFSYFYAKNPSYIKPSPSILIGSWCNTIQNEGYPNWNNPIEFYDSIGVPSSLFCGGPCAADPGCIPTNA